MEKVYDQAYKTEICKRAVEGGEVVSAISMRSRNKRREYHLWMGSTISGK